MCAVIPEYPDSRVIELEDRDLFQSVFRLLQPQISELSFANLLLFRNIHRYHLSYLFDSLVISACGYDGNQYFLPPLSGNVERATRQLLTDGKVLYGVDEYFRSEYLAVGEYRFSPDRDNDDYLYLLSDLANLSGSRYHKKRNRISYFSLRNRYSVELYSKSYLDPSLRLLQEWTRVQGAGAGPSVVAESAAAREALELSDELGLTGVVILTDQGVSAFALGEVLNNDTIVCHFEKADPFLEGAAQLVNREFSRMFQREYLFVNREQDLGESGLRGAKNSYHPHRMIRKYRVTLESNS